MKSTDHFTDQMISATNLENLLNHSTKKQAAIKKVPSLIINNCSTQYNNSTTRKNILNKLQESKFIKSETGSSTTNISLAENNSKFIILQNKPKNDVFKYKINKSNSEIDLIETDNYKVNKMSSKLSEIIDSGIEAGLGLVNNPGINNNYKFVKFISNGVYMTELSLNKNKFLKKNAKNLITTNSIEDTSYFTEVVPVKYSNDDYLITKL